VRTSTARRVAVLLPILFAGTVAIQAARDGLEIEQAHSFYLYVPTGGVLGRLALSYDALAADLYWIRAIQLYGGAKRASAGERSYAGLYTLLDITTTLDPRFNIAYRFGSVFLAESYPDGAGRPDLAIALLEKGLRAQPSKWQYMQDIGFVYYWWLHDYRAAADWFRRAATVKGAPWWLETLAATTLAEGGDRRSSRRLWEQLGETADHEWLRQEARRRLLQLSALDELDVLKAAVGEFTFRARRPPESWDDLARAGLLASPPVDPTGSPYLLDPRFLTVRLGPASPLFPLPGDSPGSPSHQRPR
jgi:tetratricopeptide (TPR) repeat protein